MTTVAFNSQFVLPAALHGSRDIPPGSDLKYGAKPVPSLPVPPVVAAAFPSLCF